MDNRFGLQPHCIEDIITVFKYHPEIEEALVFGSRAMGTYKNGSDIDIAIKGEKVTFDTITSVRIRLDELPYAYTYDVINYNTITSKELIAHIDELGIGVYKRESEKAGWKRYKLSEITKIIGGGTPSTSQVEYWNGDIPWLTPKDLTNHLSKYISHGERNISEEGLSNSSARMLPKGAVLLTSRAPIGYLAIASNELCTNQGFKSLVPHNTYIDNEFLYYLLKANVEYIKSQGTGSTFAEISGSVLGNMEFDFPDLPIQRAIASILSALDDKIEINQQMNRTLEAIAQALYKEWFVNFNFPDEDGKPYRDSGGEMVDGIPKGWKKVELSGLISVKDGTHDSPKQQEKGPFLITSKHLKKDYIDFVSAYNISEEDFEKINKRSKVDQFDVLITMIGTVGNLHFVNEEHINFAIKNIGLFKTSERLDLCYYIYLSFRSKEIEEYFLKRLAGSTQQYLTLESLRQIPIIFSDSPIFRMFNFIAESIFNKININQTQTQTLTAIRDSLLPGLMTGRIEVHA